MLPPTDNNNELNGPITLTPITLTTTNADNSLTRFGSEARPRENEKYDDHQYKGPKIWLYLVRNWPIMSEPLAIIFIFLSLWTIGYILMPTYALPHTVVMRIIFLFIGAQTIGVLFTFIQLPDMLGMLFFGVLYANLGWANFKDYEKFEAFLREMALINIMLLAGLGLNANAFKKLWFMILRLTLIPTVAEVAIIAILGRFLLSMPWLWGVCLGLIITAVSPNVVVTVMLKLKEERLGLNDGIHTLIYAMTACNDILAIFLFGVMIGIIFSKGHLSEQLLQGPIGIGIGLVYGYLFGLMLQFVPSRNASTVAKRLDLLWKFLKPVSFALIGKEINFAVLNAKVVSYGALLVLLGSLSRLVFAYVSTYGGHLTKKERAYITISGFPKATVQAALGPIALDLARSLNASADKLLLASNVLIISVLAIIFTAPLGAILMLRLAPRWLKHTPLEGSHPYAFDNTAQYSVEDNTIDTICEQCHRVEPIGSQKRRNSLNV
ncbi:na[+]/H[+] hydrogen antiporter 2 isoform 3-T7 [Glossina fuscipes fuscipes]